jgi:myo-inositol 2-dehydrogenase / D-chiro-inositol 1-dehydrogenase
MNEPNEQATPSPDRRDFLMASAAVAAATLAPAGVFAAGDETIKVGLIGCGGRGSGAASDCLKADKAVKIVAVGDAFEFRAKGCLNSLSRQFKDRIDVGDRIFTGLDAYQKVLDSGIDLVILATPPGFRPLHLEAAVKAGKNIFTEKPVGVDGPGIRRVLAAYEEAKKKNLAIVAGTQRRHQTGYLETMKRVHGGEIGDIVAANGYWNGHGIWFNPRSDLKNHGVPDSDVAYQIYNWYHFLWICGDHIVEQHVHNLDVINWAMNSRPVKAWGLGGRLNLGGQSNRRPGDPNEVGNIFDHFSVEYEYANGVKLHSYCCHIDGTVGNVSEMVVGSKGVCRTQDRQEYSINRKPVFDPKQDNAPYVQEHADLIASIRSGGTHVNELKQVAESTLTAILGRMATYTGKMVSWEQALNSKEDTFPQGLSWDMRLQTLPAPIPGKTKFV